MIHESIMTTGDNCFIMLRATLCIFISVREGLNYDTKVQVVSVKIHG